MNLRVTADEKQIEGHYLLALVSNIRHYAVVEISPTASIDDGQMDLWLLSGSTLADAFRHMFEILAGQHVASDLARCVRFQKAIIESDTAFPIQMDGEPMLGAQRVILDTLHQRLRVLIPAQSRRLLCSEQV
jgi:diacylglycerol kinase family enzyme